ncbi:hypothetical protein [Thermococcus sp. PK]|uniref:hypothetical protein n=1 Tax=Thermococcus sp. PK TaxID=913025 RepID=UPI0012ECB1DE|nr:hypothetical protein [Thermococcus sp. PK]
MLIEHNSLAFTPLALCNLPFSFESLALQGGDAVIEKPAREQESKRMFLNQKRVN